MAAQKSEEIVIPEIPDPYIGTTLGERYRILKKLGAGGMGAVYLAEHIVIERKVAIKILGQDYATKADLVQRFIQEARAAARIGHENIVEVHDFGETASGSVFFAMEYLEGTDLAGLIQRRGVLTAPEIRAISIQICKALAAAHSKQIVHRDLKPENIFLIEKDGRRDFVKILDFGIAKINNVDDTGGKLTRAGMIFGTPEYMSPEQARGEIPDHRVDIYALGCIIYEMLTGKVPFQGETFMGTLTKHMFELPEPPSRRAPQPVPPDLEAICLRAMDKDRDRRFQTMVEFAQALDGEAPVAMLMAHQASAPHITHDPSLHMRRSQGQVPPPPPSYSPMPTPGAAGYPVPQMMPPGYSAPMGVPMGMSGPMISAGQPISGMYMQPSGPIMPGAHIPGMSVPAIAGYSHTAPPTSFEVSRQGGSAQWRRMVFILGGAAIGVVILSILLFWPPSTSTPVTAGPSGGRTSLNPPLPLVKATAPARLTVRGVAASQVFLDFRAVGSLLPDGTLAFDAPTPGTPEWSAHIKVARPGYEDFTTRLILRTGESTAIQAEQPIKRR